MRGKHGNHAKAAKQARWSEQKMITKDGYVKIGVGKDHPLADPNGYTYEHLVVWCAAGRERPARGWMLHHDNEVKSDNRLGNLKLMTRGGHNHLHLAARKRDEKTGRLQSTAGAMLDGREWRKMPA